MLRPKFHPALLVFTTAVLVAGCATVAPRSGPDEVQAFFGAANEANFQGIQSGSAKQLDLSGYTHLMGVKYPPTQVVDVLSGPPSRPYQAFALLETAIPHSSETYDPRLLDSLKSQARAIGADAIIFPSPQNLTGLPGLQQSSKLAAVAVKYRLEGPPKQTKHP
jgi:hypothetical protein